MYESVWVEEVKNNFSSHYFEFLLSSQEPDETTDKSTINKNAEYWDIPNFKKKLFHKHLINLTITLYFYKIY